MQVYNTNNIFAKILRKEIPATVVYEDDSVLAFRDINPKAKTHVLVIPKGEYINFTDFTAKASSQEVSNFFQKANEIATEVLLLSHFQLHVNNGEASGQEVLHFHVHVLSSQK
jgi:histidine triad (HIT) family protein